MDQVTRIGLSRDETLNMAKVNLTFDGFWANQSRGKCWCVCERGSHRAIRWKP